MYMYICIVMCIYIYIVMYIYIYTHDMALIRYQVLAQSIDYSISRDMI